MKIHIKEKNKGKFTASAKAAGQSVQEHAKSVLNDPNATPLQKKRANFARNAAKWNHKKKKYFIGGTFEPIINTSNIQSNLTQLPYNLDYLNNLQEIKKRQKLQKIQDEANRTNQILETITGLASDYFKTKNSPAISFNAPSSNTSSTFKVSSFWNNPTLQQ